MKFCAVVCEYNPFHNGHAYQLARIREESGCDKILCLMSGDFTQRGEAAVWEKYVRAKHAVLGGADAVLELPAAFAVSPAEIFARGAVHILSSVPAVKTLAFGCESGTKEDFLALGKALASEDKAFKAALKEQMKDGGSYIRARNAAIAKFFPEIDGALLSSPNNILGGEYCHALLTEKSAIEPLPILRTGGGYGEREMRANYSSASALRLAMDDFKHNKRLIKKNLPAHVFSDLPAGAPAGYETAALCALVRADAARIAETPDCSEGLENRLKTLVKTNAAFAPLVEKAVSKRYTRARIQRILAQNFLGVTARDAHTYLGVPLYLHVLAVKKEGAEEILSALSEAKFPAIVRKSDVSALKKEALACYETDLRAAELYNVLASRSGHETAALFL